MSRELSIQWALSVMANPRQWAILDTETTGFAGDDEVIQIGILGVEGETLLESLVKPVKGWIHPQASKVNGITMEMLADAPLFREIHGNFSRVLRGRRVIAYNAPFDQRLIAQSERANGLEPLSLEWKCAMQQFTRFSGSQTRLQGGDHSAIGDCQATLEVIKVMAMG